MRPLLDLNHNVHTLDLGFLDLPGTIAAYLIPHAKGAVLVECGPGSTIANLIDAINAHGLNRVISPMSSSLTYTLTMLARLAGGPGREPEYICILLGRHIWKIPRNYS